MMVAARHMMAETVEGGRSSVPVAAALPLERLGAVVQAALVEKSARQTVRREEDFRLWCLLRAVKVVQPQDADIKIEIDAARILADTEAALPCTFAHDAQASDSALLVITPQHLYQAISAANPDVDNRKLDAIRPFFNSAEVRRRILPLEVEHRKARGT